MIYSAHWFRAYIYIGFYDWSILIRLSNSNIIALLFSPSQKWFQNFQFIFIKRINYEELLAENV